MLYGDLLVSSLGQKDVDVYERAVITAGAADVNLLTKFKSYRTCPCEDNKAAWSAVTGRLAEGTAPAFSRNGSVFFAWKRIRRKWGGQLHSLRSLFSEQVSEARPLLQLSHLIETLNTSVTASVKGNFLNKIVGKAANIQELVKLWHGM